MAKTDLNIESSSLVGNSNVSSTTRTFGGWVLDIEDFKGRKLSIDKNFEPKSITITEKEREIPKFSVEFEAPMPLYMCDLKEFKISMTLEKPQKVRNYNCYVINFQPYKLDGVLLSKELYFDRASANLSDDLIQSIQQLNIRSEVRDETTEASSKTGVNTSTTDTTTTTDQKKKIAYTRLNESAWECAARLLDNVGKDKTWAILHNKIKIFKKTPAGNSEGEEYNIGNPFTFELSSMRKGDLFNKNSTFDANTSKNIFFARHNVIQPRLSRFNTDSIIAAVNLMDNNNGWNNEFLSKSWGDLQDFDIGDTVRFKELGSNFGSVIVNGMTITLYKHIADYRYFFKNEKSWGLEGSEEQK